MKRALSSIQRISVVAAGKGIGTTRCIGNNTFKAVNGGKLESIQ